MLKINWPCSILVLHHNLSNGHIYQTLKDDSKPTESEERPREGNMPINFLLGPWYFDWDTSIIKNIRLTEKTKLQLRAEAFNTLNQARFTLPTQFNNINSSTFGRSTGTFPSARVIQFVGRFEF